MSEKINYVAERLLEDIDAFVEGRPVDQQQTEPYSNLINPRPFTSRKLKARVGNKFVSLPVKIFKKSFHGYLAQKDKELIETRQRLADIEDRLVQLEAKIDQATDTIIDTIHKKQSKKD